MSSSQQGFRNCDSPTPEQRAERAFPCLLIAVKHCARLFPHDMPWCENCRTAEIVAQQIREAVEAERTGMTEMAEAALFEQLRTQLAEAKAEVEKLRLRDDDVIHAAIQLTDMRAEMRRCWEMLGTTEAESQDDPDTSTLSQALHWALQYETDMRAQAKEMIERRDEQLARYKRVEMSARELSKYARRYADYHVEKFYAGDASQNGGARKLYEQCTALDAALAECEP